MYSSRFPGGQAIKENKKMSGKMKKKKNAYNRVRVSKTEIQGPKVINSHWIFQLCCVAMFFPLYPLFSLVRYILCKVCFNFITICTEQKFISAHNSMVYLLICRRRVYSRLRRLERGYRIEKIFHWEHSVRIYFVSSKDFFFLMLRL